MSENHSELPWRQGYYNQACIYSAYNKLVANTSGVISATEQGKANAAFIVEACNNYEAVKKERDELRNELSSFIALLESGVCPSDEDFIKAKKLLNNGQP